MNYKYAARRARVSRTGAYLTGFRRLWWLKKGRGSIISGVVFTKKSLTAPGILCLKSLRTHQV